MNFNCRDAGDDPADLGGNIYRHIVESATDYAVITAALDGRITTCGVSAPAIFSAIHRTKP